MSYCDNVSIGCNYMTKVEELENKLVETTVGQNYTTIFKEYISEKVHYKVGEK